VIRALRLLALRPPVLGFRLCTTIGLAPRRCGTRSTSSTDRGGARSLGFKTTQDRAAMCGVKGRKRSGCHQHRGGRAVGSGQARRGREQVGRSRSFAAPRISPSSEQGAAVQRQSTAGCSSKRRQAPGSRSKAAARQPVRAFHLYPVVPHTLSSTALRAREARAGAAQQPLAADVLRRAPLRGFLLARS